MPNTSVRELVFTGLHMLAFGITCALWFWTWTGHLRLFVSLALAACIAIGLGSVTEYLQTFSPDRHPSWGDFAANYAGVFIAAAWIWHKYIAPV